MDSAAKAWMRAWLMGAATAGMVAPDLLAGGGAQFPVPPRRTTVQPASHQQAGSDVTVAESEVQQQLRLMYERDGREMPDLNIAGTPAAPGVTGAGAVAPRLQQTPPPRYSSAPPTAPKASPNKVTSFFKKLVPGSNKKAQATSYPPRQLPPSPPQQLPNPVPQPSYSPQVQTQFAPQPSAPVIVQPAVPLPPSPAATATPVTFGNPAATSTQTLAPRAAAGNPQNRPLPEPTLRIGEPAISETTEIPLIPKSPAEVGSNAPVAEDDRSIKAETPATDDDFPDPFGEAEEAPAAKTAAPLAEPEFTTEPEDVSDEAELNPYTGKSLDEFESPAVLTDSPELEPVAAPSAPAVDESTAAKMRRIIQRSDMKGLKGFCPVTLRDQRELADSKPEFVGAYRGQKFFFASEAALAKFEEDPARYAPAAYGADVVILTNAQDVVEGTLDYAAWYKGRLYLFESQQTHDRFVADPEKFATPPGID